MRDHFSYKTSFSMNMELHFYIFLPLIKDHLSYKTIFVGLWGGLKTQVSLYMHYRYHTKGSIMLNSLQCIFI